MKLRRKRLLLIKQTKRKRSGSPCIPGTACAEPNYLRRHTTQPSENSAVPLAGCSTPSGHSSFPGHFGSSLMAMRLRYVPCSCFLWQASQKCVLPQQYHELTEQQNLHLYVMYFLPCFLQLLALGPLAHDP